MDEKLNASGSEVMRRRAAGARFNARLFFGFWTKGGYIPPFRSRQPGSDRLAEISGTIGFTWQRYLSVTLQLQRRPFVHRNVIGLLAFDFILRIVTAGMARMAFVISVGRMHFRVILPLTWPASEFQVT